MIIRRKYHINTGQIIWIILIVTLFSSCKHTTQPSTDFDPILPLSVGNSWTYARTWSRLDSISLDTITMSITSMDTVQGVVGYNTENLIIGPFTWFEGSMIDGRSDGLYWISWPMTYPPTKPSATKALSYPTVVGESINFEGYKITTESVSEIISTQAGSFNCVKYVVNLDSTIVGIIWSKPGTGFVKTQAQYGLVRYDHELISYSLK